MDDPESHLIESLTQEPAYTCTLDDVDLAIETFSHKHDFNCSPCCCADCCRRSASGVLETEVSEQSGRDFVMPSTQTEGQLLST